MKQDREIMIRNLLSSMRRISQLFRSRMHFTLEKDINPGSLTVMTTLLRAAKDGVPALRVSEIAASLWISAPGVTRLITGLEHDGYVRRDMDPDDRRGVLVSLTDRGREAMAPAMEELLQRFRGLVDYLGEEESGRLIDLLRSVEDYFGEQ